MAKVFPDFYHKVLLFFLPLVLLISGSSFESLDYSDKLGKDYVGLGEVYEEYFPVGTCLDSFHLDEPGVKEHLIKNFTSLTIANELKQPYFNPSEDVYNFAGPDKIVAFAQENNMELRGHCLLWPTLGSWICYSDAEKTQLVDKATLYNRLDKYIFTVMDHYGEAIDIWDIGNELFNFDSTAEFKDYNPMFEIAGEEVIEWAFELATKYKDDNDKFFVNETKVLNNTAKEKYLFKYVEKWLKQGWKIDGIGIQGHFDTVSVNENPYKLQDIIDRVKKLGLEVHITEMTMNVYTTESMTRYPNDIFPKNVQVWQINKFKRLFEVCRKNAGDPLTSVTFWGMADGYTGAKNDGDIPTLFDTNKMPKQNFFAVCDF